MKDERRCRFPCSLDGFVNPCRGIGGSHRKLLDGAGGKLATVATSPADSEESSLGVPEVAPPSSQHRNSITPPSVHAFVLILFVFLFFSHFVWSLYFSFSLFLALHFRRDSRTRGYKRRRRLNRNRNRRARPSFHHHVIAKVEAFFEYRNYDALAAVPRRSRLNVQSDIRVSRTSA